MRYIEILTETMDSFYIQNELDKYFETFKSLVEQELSKVNKSYLDFEEKLANILRDPLNSIIEDYVGGLNRDIDLCFMVKGNREQFQAYFFHNSWEILIYIPKNKIPQSENDDYEVRQIWEKLVEVLSHEMIHAISNIKSSGKVLRQKTYDVNKISNDFVKYLSDHNEIEAKSSDVAFELYNYFKKRVENPTKYIIYKMQNSPEDLFNVSSVFYEYYEYIGEYAYDKFPSYKKVWNTFISKVVKKLNNIE